MCTIIKCLLQSSKKKQRVDLSDRFKVSVLCDWRYGLILRCDYNDANFPRHLPENVAKVMQYIALSLAKNSYDNFIFYEPLSHLSLRCMWTVSSNVKDAVSTWPRPYPLYSIVIAEDSPKEPKRCSYILIYTCVICRYDQHTWQFNLCLNVAMLG